MGAHARRAGVPPWNKATAMIQIERYLFRTAIAACVSGLVVLTAVVWVTQALRQIDLITSKGQTILIFLMMTGLVLPSLVAIIAPVEIPVTTSNSGRSPRSVHPLSRPAP